ncbi:MAG: hypothetical protein F6J93_05120 [Oscillatoria sp. SIO1A7]|nr:hypothetical protein [Oscillatoria sp. SIO1A7]
MPDANMPHSQFPRKNTNLFSAFSAIYMGTIFSHNNILNQAANFVKG